MNDFIKSVYQNLPYSDYSEQVVIGSLMHDINRIELSEYLRPEMFQITDGVNRPILFTQLIEYSKTNTTISPTAFVEWLIKSQQLPRITEKKMKVLEFFARAVSDPEKYKDHAKEVEDSFKKRKTMLHCVETIKEASLPGGDITATMATLENELQLLSTSSAIEVHETRGQSENFINRINERIRVKKSNQIPGLPTYIAKIDKEVNGFRDGDLIIIAARSSVGKTALTRTFIILMALAGLPVLIFSMEETMTQWVDKAVSFLAGIPYWKLRSGMLEEYELKKAVEASAVFETLPIFIDDRESVSVEDIRTTTRVMKRKHKIRACFVDYIQIVKRSGRASRWEEIGEVAKGLKRCAKNKFISMPIFALSQLSKGAVDEKPSGKHISGADEIFHAADYVIVLDRPYVRGVEQDGNGQSTFNQAFIYWDKARDIGYIPDTELYFDTDNAEFRDNEEPRRGTKQDAGDFEDGWPDDDGESPLARFEFPNG